MSFSGFFFGEEAGENALHEAGLLALGVDDEVLFVADGFGELAEGAGAEGVEGADDDFFAEVVADHVFDALAHFGGGFVGEGDGEDVLGGDAFIDHVGDAGGDDAGFAGASAGEDEDGAVDVLGGVALLGVEGAGEA